MATTTLSDYRHLPQQDQSLPRPSTPLRNDPPTSHMSEKGSPDHSSWLPSRHAIVKFWVIESLAAFFSLALFGAIIAVLALYDEKLYKISSTLEEHTDIKRAPIYPTLSILGTVMRACLLLPVAACIGQLKWSWFQKPRKLVGIERFDEASHGVTGSLLLLWTVRLRHLVAVGAALTILALPIDALIQSSVLIKPHRLVNTVAYSQIGSPTIITNSTTLPKTNVYSEHTGDANNDPWASIAMVNAVKFGLSWLSGLYDTADNRTLVQCPTGDCQFGTFQTLGVGNVCQDRSEELQDYTGYLGLPDADLRFYDRGGQMDGTEFQQMIIAAKTYTNNKVKSPGLIARTVVIIKPLDENAWQKPAAVDCYLRWIISTINGTVNQATGSSVIDSALSETDVYGDWNVDANPVNESLAIVLTPTTTGCWVNGTEMKRDNTLYNEECSCNVTKEAAIGVQRMLTSDTDEGLRGYYFFVGQDESDNQSRNIFNQRNHFINNIDNLIHRDDRSGTIMNIEYMFQNIGWSMTRMLRRHSGDIQKYTSGTVWAQGFIYKINWVRLTYPAIIVVGCNLFFIAVAVRTSKHPDWRGSNLPLVFHRLGGGELQNGPLRNLADMEAVAEETVVRLEETPEGPRLVSIGTK